MDKYLKLKKPGNYRKLPQIGGVNTKLSDGTLSMGKIERAVWNDPSCKADKYFLPAIASLYLH